MTASPSLPTNLSSIDEIFLRKSPQEQTEAINDSVLYAETPCECVEESGWGVEICDPCWYRWRLERISDLISAGVIPCQS